MKVLAIANAGGHFIQLLRLRPAWTHHETHYMSSKENFAELVAGHKFYYVPNVDRTSRVKVYTGFFMMFVRVCKIVLKLRPDVIITTGAALGLMGLVAGKLTGAKTIWVDSIANAEKLSLSGRMASKVAKRSYTQWPDLVNKRFIYEGNVLS